MSLLDRKVRGFRLIDLAALGTLVVLILGVYLAKTMAGSERAEIARVERQIDLEKERIRLLQAEVSHLEQPARIEHLSETYLGLGPVSIKHETTSETLVDVMGNPNVAAASSSPIALAAAANAKAAAEARALEAMASDQPVAETDAADEAHQ